MPYEDVVDEEHEIPSTTKTKIRDIVKNHTLTLILKNQESLNLISPLLFLNYYIMFTSLKIYLHEP